MQEEAKLSSPLGPEEHCWRCDGVYVLSTMKSVYTRGYTPERAKTWIPLGKVCEPCLLGDVTIDVSHRRMPG